MAHYLIAYDISKSSRRRKIAKIVYSYALGGQKSALETMVSPREAYILATELSLEMKTSEDKINLIQVDKNPILLGKATQLNYDEGVILI